VKKPTIVLPQALLALGMFASVFVWQRNAVSQIQVAPSYVPIGVAAGGSASTAWFHHPASGRVVACHATAGASGGIQCAEGRLP